MDDLPSQRHSRTSRAGARGVSKWKATAQERWVYNSLQFEPLTDWELWELAEPIPGLFDQLSSLHRARIGLMWTSKVRGPTAYHPVEDAGTTRVNPRSNRECVVWRIKQLYLGMPYDAWVQKYKTLAHETVP